MRTSFFLTILIIAVALPVSAWGQASAGPQPHIGYLYPAGGTQGATVRITAGGQALSGANGVIISGEGVQCESVRYVRPLNNKQLQTLTQRLKQRRDELEGKKPPAAQSTAPETSKPKQDLVPLPNHPWIENIDTMTMKDLDRVTRLFYDKKKQPNAQIAEMAIVDVTIDQAASPGVRELRVRTGSGLTNPMPFEVGALPEVLEEEPNDPPRFSKDTVGALVDMPITLNGQVMPGDIDRFGFRAHQGERIVADVHARRLIPYLADAVPGWFQAVLAVYDAQGHEVAFSDDYQFNPDPRMSCTIPSDGDYVIEIRDALYRGREDFVYRITLGDTKDVPSTPVPVLGESFPECAESEPNDSNAPQSISLPCVVTGCVSQGGDTDVFQLQGHKGDEIVVDVCARRIASPLDSLVRLMDESGQVLVWNDDYENPELGLLTHQADSYAKAVLPGDGSYRIELTDAQGHGGPDYGYRLRVGPPQPDFALRVTPSSVNIREGRSAVVTVHAMRKDGYSGAINLTLKNGPAGLTLDGATVPAGVDRIRMTLTAGAVTSNNPIALDIEGAADIGGQMVRHTATPAEDMMQAFIYRHLVPCQNLLVTVLKSKAASEPVKVATDTPVQIPSGQAAQIYVKAPVGLAANAVTLELSEPPKGIALTDVVTVPDGMVLEVKAEPDVAKVGLYDNLIVDAYTEGAVKDRNGKPAQNKQRVRIGALPAIPFEVSAP